MGKRRTYFLSFTEIKEKKQRKSYSGAKSYPGNFWDLEQKEMYDKIYSTMQVFQHKYVKWSDISDLGNVLSAKYEKLGIKDLSSYDSRWVWNEDTIKKFYGTLFIDSDCTTMDFMIGSKHCEATKKDLENALGINPGDKDIIALHSMHKWKKDNADACSLYIVPTANTKVVRHLKPEVDLIQKINRMTLLPRSGTQDVCSDMLLKLAHAIYHEKHFDIAHFILSEMRIATQTPDHALPYGHYIYRLLRHMKFIPQEIVDKECSLLEYSPQIMEQPVTIGSVAESMAQLSDKLNEFCETLEERFDTLQERLEKVERLHMEEVRRRKDWEKRF